MNDYKLFLMGCYSAVVRIRPFTNDLYNFVRLMELVGFKKDIEWFEKNCCDSRTREEKEKTEYIREEDFCEDYFLHLLDINNVKRSEVCIEYQLDKGFTFGNKSDYDNGECKILSVNDLIKATEYESYFMLDGKEIMLVHFNNKYADLDNFCIDYDWRVQKFGNLYNILDTQTEEFRFDKNVSLDKIINEIYIRMFDYWIDEGDIDGLIEEGSIDYVNKTFEDYIKLGLYLGLLSSTKNKEREYGLYNYYKKIWAEYIEEGIK